MPSDIFRQSCSIFRQNEGEQGRDSKVSIIFEACRVRCQAASDSDPILSCHIQAKGMAGALGKGKTKQCGKVVENSLGEGAF